MSIKHFIIPLPDGMPKGTAQQKGERVISNGGRPYVIHYKKKNVREARKVFAKEIDKHRPEAPTDCPISLTLVFYFDVKDKKKWGKPKTTRPDADNIAKELIDTFEGYWRDDAQIYRLDVQKYYAETAFIEVRLEFKDGKHSVNFERNTDPWTK